MLAKSNSLPLLEAEFEDPMSRESPEFSWDELQSLEDSKSHDRLACSHYSFFALRMGKKDLAPCEKDYWKRMALKEKRELGRRAQLLPQELLAPPRSRPIDDLPDETSTFSSRSFWLSTPDALSASQSVDRLPALPPPGLNEPFREGSAGTKRSRPVSEQKSYGVGLASLMMKPAERTEHMEVVMRDLCEGFQVCLLGEPAPQVPRSMRLKEPMKIYRLPGREETMKVYRVYCNLLQSEGVDAGGGLLPELPPDKDGKKANLHETRAFHHPSLKKANEQARRRQRRNGQLTEEIARISWSTLLQWVQHLEDLAADFRYRSVTAALNRALHQWRKKQATPRQQQEGVDLSMIIQWTWPDVTEDKIADMMLWIFEIELSKFKQPTPRLMDPHDRRILEALFRRLDDKNVGSCSPEDIAGSKEEDENEGHNDKMKNIVDVDTVKAVVGQERVELLPFLELMCESGVRAHEAATEVLLDDGRKLVLQYRRAVDSKVWVFDGTPADEEQPRRVARVFEAEVIRWRALAQATQRAEAQAAQEALLAQQRKEREKQQKEAGNGKETQEEEEEEELELQMVSSDSDSEPEEQAPD